MYILVLQISKNNFQLKRLSIAVEIMSMPSLIFLDEPTSGLDSVTSHEVMAFSRKLAYQGRTILATIHQVNVMYGWMCACMHVSMYLCTYSLIHSSIYSPQTFPPPSPAFRRDLLPLRSSGADLWWACVLLRPDGRCSKVLRVTCPWV